MGLTKGVLKRPVTTILVILCLIESQSPEVVAQENQVLYYILAVVAVVISVSITVRNNKAQKADQPAGPRLK